MIDFKRKDFGRGRTFLKKIHLSELWGPYVFVIFTEGWKKVQKRALDLPKFEHFLIKYYLNIKWKLENVNNNSPSKMRDLLVVHFQKCWLEFFEDFLFNNLCQVMKILHIFLDVMRSPTSYSAYFYLQY